MNNLYQTQGKRGQDRGGAVPRGRDGHHAGRAWRHQVRLHLRWRWQAQGDEQEDNLYQVEYSF